MAGIVRVKKINRLNTAIYSLLAVTFFGLLAGCSATPSALPPVLAPTPSITVVKTTALIPTQTIAPTLGASTSLVAQLGGTATFTAAPPSPSPTPGPRLCSPLDGVTLKELPDMVAGNTYQTPMPGRDSGHPGVDFAFYSHGDRKTFLGLPLHAAMAATVAAVIPDRMPYGNTVILEIPLENIPDSWLGALNWPTPAPPVVPDARLTCPDPLSLPAWDTSRRSLYLLYGHLNQPSTLKPGETVSCGQVIGEAGTTGASVNPHLHFEARLGPAGMKISSFGHYDTHTTAEERNNYCVWRVSGWLQVVDPLALLAQQP